MTRKITHIDLFSGIGGFSLAAQWCWGEAHEPVLFCEIDKWAQKVLRKHWPDVPIMEDVKDVKRKNVADTMREGLPQWQRQAREIKQAGIRLESENRAGSEWPDRIDLLTGGFPCQPFSCAGKRLGNADDRALWGEMLGVIQDFQPRWVIAENVRGILSIQDGLVFEQVCIDLEDAGYEVQPFVIPAVACDAKHRRDRVWFVAHADTEHLRGSKQECEHEGAEVLDGSGKDGLAAGRDVADTTSERRKRPKGQSGTGKEGQPGRHTSQCCKTMDDPSSVRIQGEQDATRGQRGKPNMAYHTSGDRKEAGANRCPKSTMGGMVDGLSSGLDRFEWPPEPEGTPRVASGVKDRQHRLRGLGNAIVPQCALAIMEAIKNTDPEMRDT